MKRTTLLSRVIFTSTLAGAFLLAFGGTARADRDWKEDCHHRLEADRARIDRDVAKYGEHSRQVDNDVARMESTRQWCKDHKTDWDHDRFDIGVYFRH